MSRILVIDDDADFRAMARRLLEEEGHEVIEAGTGSEGIEMFRALQPDVIVTDIFMPGKSGVETIMQIREESTSVRIIAVSGNGGIAAGDILGSALRAGANQTLAKPFPMRQFVDAVQDDKSTGGGQSR
ncbi:response regulator transcription factor [Dongia sedimenti]|uniref:Response regulator n=1 Tax=Dongia sedimenti TaxID=3064282 RepID=A0ABU0YW78_9PROT|nr:response regulator [Rhodospirillaceae bacterium R-7]